MNTVLAPSTSFHAERRDVWRVAPGSHLAVAPDRHGMAVRAHVAAGTLAIDPVSGVGSLTVEFAVGGHAGRLRGIAVRGTRDAHGRAVWTVRGSLDVAGRTTSVTLSLRDHGVTHSRCTWWWLSGTGEEQSCARRPRFGSRLVADLLLTPAVG